MKALSQSGRHSAILSRKAKRKQKQKPLDGTAVSREPGRLPLQVAWLIEMQPSPLLRPL